MMKTFRSKVTGKVSRRSVTDSIEYAWFHWWEGSTGKTVVLASTPKDERL
jgi:hypothetical protein